MEIELVLPTSFGEWMAWLTALICVLVGLWLMIMPKMLLKVVNLLPVEGTREGASEIRGPFGGYWAGIGLAALILHPQPLMYLAIGFAFAFAVIGRLIGVVVERAISPLIAAGIVADALLAYFPLAYAFGWTT